MLRKRLQHKFREIDRAKEAGAVRWQWLLAARIRRANILDEPVVIHLVDLVDQHKAGLGVIIGRCHDDIPHPARRHTTIDLAGHQAIRSTHVVVRLRPLPPNELLFVVDIQSVLLNFFRCHRKSELPVIVVLDRSHKLVGNQERQIELPQAAVFTFRAYKIHDVRMADIERTHLRTAPTPGR